VIPNPNQDLIDRLLKALASAEYSKNIDGISLLARTIAELRNPLMYPAHSVSSMGWSYGVDSVTDQLAQSAESAVNFSCQCGANQA
jgi:hypothetical protein